MQGPVKTGPFAVQVTATDACVRSALVSVVPGRSSSGGPVPARAGLTFQDA